MTAGHQYLINDPLAGEVLVVTGADVQIGDVLMFLSTAYRIDRIEPASDATRRVIADPQARFAYSGPDFSITLCSTSEYRVLPRVFRPTA